MLKTKKRIDFWNLFLDFAGILLGSISYSIAIAYFLEPSHISPGGVSGIATVLHFLFELPTGIMIIVLNVPLFILGFIFLGFKFLAKTAIATVVSAAFVDLVPVIIPEPFTGERILASLYGGLLLGLGIGLIMMRGATTGGTDIAAKLIHRKFPSVTMGRGILMLDAVVVIITAVVYSDIESALFTVIAIFASSKLIDMLLYGTDNGKILYIVSPKYREIADEIISGVDRGVTFLPATGAYTNTPHTMIMCAVRSSQVVKVRSLIRHIDPNAFVMVAEAGAILGEGFGKNETD